LSRVGPPHLSPFRKTAILLWSHCPRRLEAAQGSICSWAIAILRDGRYVAIGSAFPDYLLRSDRQTLASDTPTNSAIPGDVWPWSRSRRISSPRRLVMLGRMGV